MKEIKHFEDWANALVNESFDRPLPLSKDIQHQATVRYPDLSPEQALIAFMGDKIDDSDKVDAIQTKQIKTIDKEVDQVDHELADVEHNEESIRAEIARLVQLLNK